MDSDDVRFDPEPRVERPAGPHRTEHLLSPRHGLHAREVVREGRKIPASGALGFNVEFKGATEAWATLATLGG